jgi:alkanesulfonate monooxygenase SsuD/methylene tetrahydromethanopterin reductase-like flavin-dependent oxidoreductase (luciferase family)
MEIGVYYTFNEPRVPTQGADVYAEFLDHIRGVDELGYDYAFITEHHFSDTGVVPSPMTAVAASVAATSRVRIGTHILLLPLYHPVRVAEEAAMVDRFSGGRMVLGIGAGYRPEEFATFGVARSSRGKRMEEGIGLLRSAWRDELVQTADNPEGVHVVPQPATPGGPPIWVGGFGPMAIDRAVRLGDAYLMGGAGAVPSDAPYGLYCDALERHGKTQADVKLVGNRIVHCAPTDEQAWDEARLALMDRHNKYARWFETAQDREGVEVVSSPEELPREDYIVGSPETCIRQIERYREQFPVDVLLFAANHTLGTLSGSLPALDLFAREVLPAFRQS